MNKLALIISIVIFVAIGWLWGNDVLSDRAYRLAVVEPAPLYSLPPYEQLKNNPVLTTLKPDQHLRVLRLRYGKDIQTFRVETESGLVGWVVTGMEVKVVSSPLK